MQVLAPTQTLTNTQTNIATYRSQCWSRLNRSSDRSSEKHTLCSESLNVPKGKYEQDQIWPPKKITRSVPCLCSGISLCHMLLYLTSLHCTVKYYTSLHCIALYYNPLHCTELNITSLHCTALYSTTLHYTTIHYTVHHYTT